METDNFKIKAKINKETFTFWITERNDKNVVSYEVKIKQPKEFASFNEIEQPLTMKYSAKTGSLTFKSKQDLSDFEYLENKLSNLIMYHSA